MKKLHAFFIAAIVLIMGGCTTFDIASDYDPEYNFRQVKTYAWFPGIKIDSGDGRIDDWVIEKRIKKAVEQELSQKGYKRVDVNEADFLVGFNAAVNEPLYRDTFYEFGVVEYGRLNIIYEERSTYQYPEFDRGSVVIDIITPDTKEIVWRGSAQAGIQIDRVSTEEKKKRLAKAVYKILKDYPPNNN